MQVHRSEKSRHLVLRAHDGDSLPRALLRALENEQVTAGWLRAGGILSEVELRTFGERSRVRHLRGPVQVVSLEGSIGLLAGRPSVGMRAVLVHETDRGVETVAGEIANAQVVALEAVVTALDDLSLSRELDEASGTWMLQARASEPATTAPSPSASALRTDVPASQPSATEAPAGWGAAIAASEAIERETPVVSVITHPSKAAAEPLHRPRAGDKVEHFAFGRCEVLKADGDRIKIKVPKDGRIREISLSALRVTLIEGTGPRRSFRLEKRTP